MLLTITATGPGADGLGYLLHKHPDRIRTVNLPFGVAHVFYPVVEPELVQAALLVEVDPIYLSRRKGAPAGSLQPYVNDRPYAASSLLSSAMTKLFGTALAGNCETRPDLVDTAFDLCLEAPVLHAKPDMVERFFGPLGWSVETASIAPADDGYLAVTLTGPSTVKDALTQLQLLLPALDGHKHYWVDEAETEKLIRRGGPWLESHPEQELIARRYLRFRDLVTDAITRLNAVSDGDDAAIGETPETTSSEGEADIERPIRLNDARIAAVLDAIRATGQTRVIDLGCGEGQLVGRLLEEPDLQRITGVDVAMSELRRAERRLKLDELLPRQRERIELIQGALTYRDDRFAGYGVATLIEVIEHLDPERLDALEESLFGFARPAHLIVTTPNVEYNQNFPALSGGGLRHDDHRFEWSRAEFAAWCQGVCERSGYSSVISGIGPDDPAVGTPTQMAVFSR